MKEYSTSLDSNFENNSIDIKREISYYLFFWPWFLVFTLILLGGTFLNLRYADRIYESSAQIQIKNSKADPSSFLTEGSGFNLNRSSLISFFVSFSDSLSIAIIPICHFGNAHYLRAWAPRDSFALR